MPTNWTDKAMDEYVYWQDEDRKTLHRINALIKDILRNGASQGIGKPERLKKISRWSRRIDAENRLVYDVTEDGVVHIYSCKGHYSDK